MRTLPTGSVEPNFGRRVRNRRQLNSLQNTWPYGYSMPIAVRYTQDFFFQAEDCIRVGTVTGVQTCALPISDICERISHVCEDSFGDLLSPLERAHGLEPDEDAIVPVRRIIDMAKAKYVGSGEPGQQVRSEERRGGEE